MIRLIGLVIVIFWTPLLSRAETDYQGIVSSLIDEVHSSKLSNGIKVIIYPRRQAPVFSAVISVRVGGVDELPGKTGISHLLEHMAFKGSKTLGTKDFAREAKLLLKLEKLVQQQKKSEPNPQIQKKIDLVNQELKTIWTKDGIDEIYSKLGGVGMNATTSSDYTNYFISLPSNALKSWCQLESDRLLEPVWRQFYSELEVVQEERRMRYVDDPEGALYIKMLANSFEVHPYRRPTIGYEEDLNNLTASDIDNFYRTYYKAENISITLVGDVDVKESLRYLEKYFSAIPSGPVPTRTNAQEKMFTGKKEFKMDFAAKPRMLLAYHKPNYPSLEDLALNLWLEAVLGHNSSELYKDLVIDRSLTSSLSYFEAPGAAFPNLYMIYAEPIEPISNDQLELEILSLLNKKLAVGITEEELEIVKNKFKAELIYGLQSNLTLASGLSYAEHVYNDWKHYFSWLIDIDQLTLESINDVARKYFVVENLIVGKQESKK